MAGCPAAGWPLKGRGKLPPPHDRKARETKDGLSFDPFAKRLPLDAPPQIDSQLATQMLPACTFLCTMIPMCRSRRASITSSRV